MVFKKAVVVTVFAALSLMGPQVASAADGRLLLSGSSTVAPLGLEVAKRFEQNNPGVRIDIQTGGSSRGINDVRTGLSDVAMVSRSLKQSETDLVAYPIAIDGISIILHSDNSIDALSDDQVRKIYTGKYRNWRELGGPDLPITVVNKAEGRSTLELFLSYFKLRNSQIKASVVIGDNQQGIKTVVGNPGAIAYVSIGTAEFEQRFGSPIKKLPMSGVEASTAELRAGNFPLSRPLNLVTKGEPNELARRFIRFAQSSGVDDIVESQFFVPLER